MNADDYLERMRKQLNGLSEQEQGDLLDEIASHIDSGQKDTAMDANRLMKELDTPEHVGRNLRNVHRPNRWIDLLIILVPYTMISPLIQVILMLIYGSDIERNNVQDPLLYLGTRIAILLFIGLALVGVQRRSPAVVLFWLTTGLGSLVSLMVREARFVPGQEKIAGGATESILLYAVLIGLFYWLYRTLKQNNFDSLLVVFALLPVVSLVFRLVATQLILPVGGLFRSPMLSSNSISVLASQAVWIASIALFFLYRQPDVRWFSLLLYSLNQVYVEMLIYNTNLPITLIYSALPVLVLLPWAYDWRSRRNIRRLVE